MEKLYFLYILFFLEINTIVIKNPFLLDNNNGYPFLLSNPNEKYNYIFTPTNILKIEKETGDHLIINYRYGCDFQNCFYILDKSFNIFVYFYNKNAYYKIQYDKLISSKARKYVKRLSAEIINGNTDSKSDIIGKKREVSSNDEYAADYIGSISIDNNFFIYRILGKKIIFVKNSWEKYSSGVIENLSNERISCSSIDKNNIICAMIIKNIPCIKIFNIICWSFNGCSLATIFSDCYDLKKYDHLIIYDTSSSNLKFICAKTEVNIDCIFFFIDIKDKNIEYSFEYILSFQIKDFSRNNCIFTEFNLEYLFCCGDINSIKCFRINKDVNNFTLIKNFTINLDGVISYLNIHSDEDKVIFYYMKTQENIKQIEQYYIYKPTCKDQKFTILYGPKDIEKECVKFNVNNLFPVQTNKYYLQKENLPNNHCFSKLNKEGLNSDKKQINIDKTYSFEFNFNINEDLKEKRISLTINISV